jgi:hypothetical protein
MEGWTDGGTRSIDCPTTVVPVPGVFDQVHDVSITAVFQNALVYIVATYPHLALQRDHDHGIFEGD